MKPILYMLCGPSSAGKSTWARKFVEDHFDDIRYVSRDEIRFSILKEGEDYFSHEKEVFKKFSGTIAQTLADGFDIIADATHIDVFSRQKVIKAIDKYLTNYNIVFIVFNTDLNICLARNSQRSGREKVPENVIKNMYKKFSIPKPDEDKRIIAIIKEKNYGNK